MDKTQAFHKEVGLMAGKQMKNDIVLSGIREMQIKITKTYSHTPMRMTKKKKKKYNTKCWQGCAETVSLIHFHGNVNGTDPQQNSLVIPQKK